ncbi:MAG: redoxin domain-containing protein [Solirubrobacterales bacterium]|nr:redoxin domain-containing protein [Solirubrobacterales bacterium]
MSPAGRGTRGRDRSGPGADATPPGDTAAAGGPEQQGRPSRNVTIAGAIVVAVLVAAAVFALVNFFLNTESGTVGIGSVGIGEKVAPFAVPLAGSDLDGDANVDPAQACAVPGQDVLRICDYFGRPLVISFWFTRGGEGCIDDQDVFDRVMAGFRGRVNAVSINVRDDRDRVRDLIEQRGWEVPVGYDRDGAVSNIYRVGGCPTFLFVRPDGVLERAEIGATGDAQLGAQVRSLLDGQGPEEEDPPN